MVQMNLFPRQEQRCRHKEWRCRHKEWACRHSGGMEGWENWEIGIDIYHCVCVSHSVVPNSMLPHGLQPTRLLCLWGSSRQEYWSGLPCPPPGDLPDPGIEPGSPALQADYHLSHKGSLIHTLQHIKQRASAKLVNSTRSSARCSVMTQRSRIRVGWGKGIRERGYIHVHG